jgi:hypothetical protein
VGGDSETAAFRSLRDAHHHNSVPSEVRALRMNAELTDSGQEVRSHDAQFSIIIHFLLISSADMPKNRRAMAAYRDSDSA